MIIYSQKVKFDELDKRLQKCLKEFDKIIGFDLVATSGFRDTKHNERVGGVPRSSHLNGLAIDLSVTDSKMRDKVLWCSFAVGIRRRGLGNTHVHLDVDESKPQDVTFFDGEIAELPVIKI